MSDGDNATPGLWGPPDHIAVHPEAYLIDTAGTRRRASGNAPQACCRPIPGPTRRAPATTLTAWRLPTSSPNLPNESAPVRRRLRRIGSRTGTRIARRTSGPARRTTGRGRATANPATSPADSDTEVMHVAPAFGSGTRPELPDLALFTPSRRGRHRPCPPHPHRGAATRGCASWAGSRRHSSRCPPWR